MSSYLQMGHDTENLVGEADLEEFTGVILSPVNRPPERLKQFVTTTRDRAASYYIVLDPQLYFPRAGRGALTAQPYFPNEFDTTDFSEPTGWNTVNDQIAAFALELGVDAVTSPINMPRNYSDEFYSMSSEISSGLSQLLTGTQCQSLTTCIVALSELSGEARANQIASIMTRHRTDGYYLLIFTNVDPRRELTDDVGLASAMTLVQKLQSHAPVTVAYSSSDMIMFKASGAANCCTSKFFNLRRFTPSRSDNATETGGGQLPYWFEHNLLAFVREADMSRLQRRGLSHLIGGEFSNSASGRCVLECLENNPGEAWVARSWRQYLSWFGKTEAILSNEGIDTVRNWLISAEKNWALIEDKQILMDEPRNNGAWIRSWRQALNEYISTAEE